MSNPQPCFTDKDITVDWHPEESLFGRPGCYVATLKMNLAVVQTTTFKATTQQEAREGLLRAAAGAGYRYAPLILGDIVSGRTENPVIGSPPIYFVGLVTSLSCDGRIAVVKLAKPYDGCTSYLSRVTALATDLDKADPARYANLAAVLRAELQEERGGVLPA